MFNPFARFESRFLPGFQQKGVKAFIKQSYDRGRNLLEENPRPAYLLIHCDDIGIAQEHYDAIKHDPNRQLFVLEDEKDFQQLNELLTSGDCRCYTMLTIKDVKYKINKVLGKRIRSYIDRNTNWDPRNWEEVIFALDFVYGEVYVKLKFGAREIKLKMAELENQVYVL